MPPHQTPDGWLRSSHSGDNGQCVDIWIKKGDALGKIRDSKNVDGPELFGDVRALMAALKTSRLG